MNVQSFNVKQYFLGPIFLLILYDLWYIPAEIEKYPLRAIPCLYNGEILDRFVIGIVPLSCIVMKESARFQRFWLVKLLHLLNR